MVIAVKDSPLQWVTRFTQVVATVYMCVAVLASVREGCAEGIPLAAVEEAWRENEFLASLRQQTPLGWLLPTAWQSERWRRDTVSGWR